MSTTQWLLSIVLLGWALTRNLGTREITRSTLLLPIVLVVVVGGYFLRGLPTGGNDVALILTAGAVGAAFGLAAGAVTQVHHRDGKVFATAGAMFATLWIAMTVGRIAFAEWANGAGARTVGQFSMEHAITGADAWTAAFVVMALGMVLVRTSFLAAHAAVTPQQSLASI